MLGQKFQKGNYSLGIKQDKKVSSMGVKINHTKGKGGGLISYSSSQPQKSYLEK